MPRDPPVGLEIGQRSLPDQFGGNFGDIVPIRIISRGDLLADHVLVEAVRTLPGDEPLKIGVRSPVAAGIGSVDLVREAEGSLRVNPELILDIGEDQVALGGQRLAPGEQGQGSFAHMPPLDFAEQTAREDFLFSQRLVMRTVGSLAGKCNVGVSSAGLSARPVYRTWNSDLYALASSFGLGLRSAVWRHP